MKRSRSDIHHEIFSFLCIAIAFFIPVYGRIIPLFIGLIVLNWIIEGQYIRTIPRIFKDRTRFILFSFSFLYIFYLLGLIYTNNFSYARFDLEIKLAILLFPLVFATASDPARFQPDAGKIIRSFAAGCIVISLVLFGRAVYNANFDDLSDAFYYSNLSWYFHPSYLAMYMTFVISNILCHMLIRKSVTGLLKISLHIFLLLYFTVFIILLSSKAGLVALIAVILFYFLLMMIRYQKFVKAITFLVVSLLVIFIGLNLFPFMTGRLIQAGKDLHVADSAQVSGKSTADRMGIWNSSLKLIRLHPFLGVGTGDVKDELLDEYRKDNVLPALEQKLNAHNQYLQTFVTLGFAGFLVLVLILMIPAGIAIRNENYLYFGFLLIFGLNMLFESMLEIQQGVIFYAFFNVVLFSRRDPG